MKYDMAYQYRSYIGIIVISVVVAYQYKTYINIGVVDWVAIDANKWLDIQVSYPYFDLDAAEHARGQDGTL